jgi:hypothetical protein
MKKLVSRTLFPTLAAIVLWSAIFFLHPRPALALNDSVQVIEVTAKKYEYSPAPIHVKSGAKIQLKITATDHDHGFSILTVPDGTGSITWSRHSRRMEPTSRSANGFCQGDRGAVSTSSIPICRIMAAKSLP